MIIDNLLSAEQSNIPDSDKVTFVHRSINDPEALEGIPNNTDYVFHLSTYHADVHYIPIRRDFSNLEVVMERIEDVNKLQRILDNAQRDLIESGEYTYQRFGQRIKAVIGNVIEEKYADNALFSSVHKFIGFQNRITTALTICVHWQNGVYLSTRQTIRAIRKRTVRFYHHVNSKRYQATQLFRAQVWDYQETDLYINLSARSKKK